MKEVADGEELLQHSSSSQGRFGTGRNNHPEMPPHSTPIRKLCRNRGLVMQDEMVATGTQLVTEDKEMVDVRQEINLTYKRRRLFQDDD